MDSRLSDLFGQAIRSITQCPSEKLSNYYSSDDIRIGVKSDYQYCKLPKLVKQLKEKSVDMNQDQLFSWLRMALTANDSDGILQDIELSGTMLIFNVSDKFIWNTLSVLDKVENNGSVYSDESEHNLYELKDWWPANGLITQVRYQQIGWPDLNNPPAAFLSSDYTETGLRNKNCLIDYSSPNIAKDLHIGHLRSTIIGESINRLLSMARASGACDGVVGVNHIGDWGTQFGLLLHQLKSEHGDTDKIMEKLDGMNCTGLTRLYKEACAIFERDTDYADKSRLETKKLQCGDPDNRQIWTKICDISRQELKKIYKLLDARNLTEKGESFYQEWIPDVMKILKEKNLTFEENGATLIRMPGWNGVLMVQKSDGGYTYNTTDLAALYYRTQISTHHNIIYVTDMGQEKHFQMCFQVAREVGWLDNTHVRHIGFGLVQDKNGKKLKTRSGDTVRLIDVVDEVVDHAKTVMKERIRSHTERGTNSEYIQRLDDAEIQRLSEKIGINTLKYFDLKHAHHHNYKYNPDVMFQLNGDSAVYIMYVYARIKNIIRKSQYDTQEKLNSIRLPEDPTELSPEDRKLIIHCMSLPALYVKVLGSFQINMLAEYLYKLCNLFNSFNDQKDGKIIGSAIEHPKIYICYKVIMIMDQLMYILGLQEVDWI